MEIREPRTNSPNSSLDWSTSGYSAAAKSLQLLAEDVTNIAAANFERNAKLIDDLRGARTVEDLVSIQTKFMAGMFETFNDHVRLMGARMAELRNGLGHTAAPGANGAAVPDGGLSQVIEATNVATLANLKATQDFTRSAFEAAEKAADTIRDTARTVLSPDSVRASKGG